MPATAERTESETELTTHTVDPMPPGMGKDGFPERVWKVDGTPVTFSLKPFADGGWGTDAYDPAKDERPRYWYIGIGARLMVKAQTMNEHGIQPTVLNERFVDGSYYCRNAWEEQVVREFLRRNHISPDYSRDEQHPSGPDGRWICDAGMCNFACPGWHMFLAHQAKFVHTGMRTQ